MAHPRPSIRSLAHLEGRSTISLAPRSKTLLTCSAAAVLGGGCGVVSGLQVYLFLSYSLVSTFFLCATRKDDYFLFFRTYIADFFDCARALKEII